MDVSLGTSIVHAGFIKDSKPRGENEKMKELYVPPQ